MNSSFLQKSRFTAWTAFLMGCMMLTSINLRAFNGVRLPDYPKNLDGGCVTCPPEWITVTCTQLDPGLNYGEPQLSPNCSYGAMISGPYIQDDRIGCGSGTITKTWQIWTYGGEYTCVQHIMVTGGGWGYPEISWPPDLILYGCSAGYQPKDLNPPYNKPTWWAPECSNLMYTWRDEVYYPEDHSGICLKIFRRWKVIDWCCYNVDDPNSGCQWTHTQLIKIMDNQPPSISCPPSMTVDAGPNCTGSFVSIAPAQGYDNCGNVTIYNNSPYDIYGGADASGYYPPGTTVITFTAKDICGNTATCKMSVTVKDKKPPTPVVHHGLTTNLMCMFPNPMIEIDPKWFDAGSFDNCTPKSRLRFSVEPKVFTCNDRGYNDIWFTVVDEAGNSETVKTYIIINDPSHCCGPDTLDPPSIVCPADMTFDATGPDCSGGYVTLPPATATSECGGPITITNDSPYAVSGGADASGSYPVGSTTVTFTAKDRCGKIAKCTMKVVVRDGKLPTPVVFQGLAVTLMPDPINGGGMITLVPKWFDAGSFDNCTDNRDLIFNVYPDFFTCDSIGIRYITFQVTDESGNTEIVRTYVDIQDPNGECDTTAVANVSGSIVTENGETVSSVDLHAESENGDVMKNVDGSYLMDSLPAKSDYTIRPEKTDNVVNGISTRDLIIIRQHILGKSLIYSPYKLVAADVNGDKVINTQDLILMRKVIMGEITEFPGTPSWKFIDQKFQFDPFSPALTQTYPTTVTLNNLRENADDVSFIAVKIGDLNSSVLASGVPNGFVVRDNSTTKLYAVRSNSEAGVTKVQFKPSTALKFNGMQMAIRFNPADYDFVSLTKADLSDMDLVINTSKSDRGIITLSAITEQSINISSADVLFNLNLREKNATKGDIVALDPYMMACELYETADQTYNVELINEQVTAADGFALYQNRPNPFQRSTDISFALPETQQIEFNLIDINGNILKSINSEFTKGLNTINIDMPLKSGVYYYSIKAGENYEVKKMVVIE